MTGTRTTADLTAAITPAGELTANLAASPTRRAVPKPATPSARCVPIS